jgi:hypothetical protein
MISLHKLKEPFPPDRISWRVGSTTKDKAKGMALAYIDARDVMQRLDDVCGPENWQCDYPHAAIKTVCRIGIKVGDEWVWKANGAGDTDIEGEKGALSDAFKRAAVLWGIGQYLYDLESPWVALDGNKIANHEFTRLHKLLGGKSSGQLKESDEWAGAMQDLAQCQTVLAIEKLFKELRKTWPQNWLNEFTEHCARRKGEIQASMADDAEALIKETFPGAQVVSRTPISTLEAG